MTSQQNRQSDYVERMLNAARQAKIYIGTMTKEIFWRTRRRKMLSL